MLQRLGQEVEEKEERNRHAVSCSWPPMCSTRKEIEEDVSIRLEYYMSTMAKSNQENFPSRRRRLYL